MRVHVYNCLGVSFLPSVMVRSLQAGLCPSLLGILTVPGTEPGTQQASINMSGIEGDVCPLQRVQRVSTSSSLCTKLSDYRRGAPLGPHPAGP